MRVAAPTVSASPERIMRLASATFRKTSGSTSAAQTVSFDAAGNAVIDWYNSPKYWPYILTICSIWKNTGYSTVLYLSAITGIDRSQYEAAAVDGATKWQQMIHVTLPHLKPMIIILLIMNVGKIFNADFGLFWSVPMNSAPLFPVTQVVDTYVYRAYTSTGNVGTLTTTTEDMLSTHETMELGTVCAEVQAQNGASLTLGHEGFNGDFNYLHSWNFEVGDDDDGDDEDC